MAPSIRASIGTRRGGCGSASRAGTCRVSMLNSISWAQFAQCPHLSQGHTWFAPTDKNVSIRLECVIRTRPGPEEENFGARNHRTTIWHHELQCVAARLRGQGSNGAACPILACPMSMVTARTRQADSTAPFGEKSSRGMDAGWSESRFRLASGFAARDCPPGSTESIKWSSTNLKGSCRAFNAPSTTSPCPVR